MTEQKEFEQEIKLFINKRLFEQGYISEMVYKKAKISIVRNKCMN